MRRYILLILSGLIVAFGQPATLFWLGPVAAACGYALLLFALRDLSRWYRFTAATLWFCVVQAVQLFWMTALEFPGASWTGVYLGLAFFLGVQSSFWVFSVTSPMKWGHVFVSAALWVLLEWARLFFLCGFSFNPVGLALTCFDEPMQLASVVGVLGLSFWVMLTNLTLVKGWGDRSRKVMAVWMGCALLPYAFGAWRLSRSPLTTDALSVAAVQTNWLPYEKRPWFGRLDAYISPLDQWKEVLSQIALLKEYGIQLVVFPEAMVALAADQPSYPVEPVKQLLGELKGFDERLHLPPSYAEAGYVSNLFLAQAVSNYLGAAVIVGLDHTSRREKKYFNSAFFLAPGGAEVKRYDKQVLLPFAEYLPFPFQMAWAQRLGFHTFFAPGSEHQQWQMGDRKISPCICYEETFSWLMHEARKRGANFFVNLTNDNYYPNSSLHDQHLFHARLRAVENGVPLLRSCNGGGSAAIDACGRIIQRVSGQKAGVLMINGDHLSHHPTVFSLIGETSIVCGCALIIILFAVPQVHRRAKRVALRLF